MQMPTSYASPLEQKLDPSRLPQKVKRPSIHILVPSLLPLPIIHTCSANIILHQNYSNILYSLRGSPATLRRMPRCAQSQYHNRRRRHCRSLCYPYTRTRRTPHHASRVGPRSQRRRRRSSGLFQCNATPTPVGPGVGAWSGARSRCHGTHSDRLPAI